MFSSITLYSARVLAILAVLCLPHSPHWSNQCLILVSLLSLLYLWQQKAWHYLWDSRVSKIAWILLAFILLACTYSIAPNISRILVGLFKYTKILYMLFLVPLFIEAKWRRYLETAFLVTVFAKIIILYYLKQYTLVNPIFVAELLAFANFLLITRCLDAGNKYFKALYGIGFLLVSYIVLVLHSEKTGYLIYFVLLVYVANLYIKGWRKYIIIPAVLATIILIAITSSATFKAKYFEFVNVMTRQITKPMAKNSSILTSTQYRIDFFKYSASIMKDHYLFGYGTNSFSYAYEKSGGTKIPGLPLLAHPHSEFTMFFVQWGLLGLGLLLYWLYVQWQLAKTLPDKEKILLRGLILTFIAHGFCDMSLYVNVPGILFVTFLGIYTSAFYAYAKR